MTYLTRRLVVLVALAAGALLTVLGVANGLPTGAAKVGMICAPGSVSGSTHTFNLVAGTGHVQTPEGNSILMWSYADANDDKVALRAFQYPGPVLCVTQGQTVVVNLTNNLPEASSIVFPGQDAQVNASGGSPGLLTTEAASGGTVSYSFTAGSPGTYLYESGSNVSKQLEMGLYGALVVRPSIGSNFAYTAATQFDPAREYMLLLSEIDPDLHHAVETGSTYDFTTLHNHYYMINGRAFPDTVQDNGSAFLPSQPYGALIRIQPNTASKPQAALIRMLNAGAENHPFHPHGNHTQEIAQDGRLLLNGAGTSRASTEHFAETIGSGQTIDYLLRWDTTGTDSSAQSFNDDWNPTTNPFPVAAPNYLNVIFKDANTWYSGNPYLGYKGTMPTGTNSLSICGEWYFPLHSHALNEFANFDAPFGGMGTLLRVDPAGGCFASPSSTSLASGALKSGSVTALAADDTTYYQVNPKTTTRTSATTNSQTSITVGSATGFPPASGPTTLSGAITAGATTITVASAANYPTSGSYFVRIDNEVLQVTGGQGTTAWTVARGQLGTAAAAHANAAAVGGLVYLVRIDNEVLAVTGGQGTATWTVLRGRLGSSAATHANGATVTALSNDWYASFSGIGTGSQGFKVTYKGKNCGDTTSATCLAIASNSPQQTVFICNWTIAGATGCSTATSRGWVALPGAPAQPQAVGSSDVSSTWTLPGSSTAYLGTGSYAGQVRVLVHTQRWTATSPTPFSTWGNFMRLVYDAP
jgi:FtsP/CotA-like multicopper oxidase with cupredoxin domain